MIGSQIVPLWPPIIENMKDIQSVLEIFGYSGAPWRELTDILSKGVFTNPRILVYDEL